MKSGSSGLQQHEYFLVQIDGRTKSGHRRFIDALRAGLQLRDQFPLGAAFWKDFRGA